MASHTQNERYLRDGAVLIYQRTDVAKPLWQCRIKFADHPYIRKSLKTQNEQDAVRAASKLYDDLRFRHQRGMPLTSYGFEYALDAYLQWLEDQGNTETDEDKARRLKKKLVDQRKFSRYIREYFADRPLDQITSAEVELYKDWRRTYWTTGPGSKLKFRHRARHYEETLRRPRREVCFPLGSGRECPEIQKPRDLGLVTAQKRTSETSSLEISF